jgi:hypothetical protein
MRSLFSFVFSSLILYSASTYAQQTIMVTDLNIDNSGGLRTAIEQVNSSPDPSGNTIEFSLTGTLTSNNPSFNLPPIQIGNHSLTIQGFSTAMPNTFNGTDIHTPHCRGFIVQSGNVTIENFTLTALNAQGGSGGSGNTGGGGGLGAGGALYVAQNASLTINNVTCTSNTATGGSGGNASGGLLGSGGGGGMGGNGGNGGSPHEINTGGGGGGLFGNGANGFSQTGGTSDAAGGSGGGGLFGNGGIGHSASAVSGTGGGGGGSGLPTTHGNGAAGGSTGGAGGGNNATMSPPGGAGGFNSISMQPFNGGNGAAGGGGGGGGVSPAGQGGSGGQGGINGGGGGGGANSTGGSSGPGGAGLMNGGGGSSGANTSGLNTAGAGGYAGGGAGAGGLSGSTAAGGAGNFGGGGGGGSSGVDDSNGAGGAGGFGGGGGGGGGSGAGGASGSGGDAGFGGAGGSGGGGTGASGGGSGAALGGTIFVENGATLTIGDNVSISSSNLTAGTTGTGTNPGSAGQTLGQEIFLKSDGTFNYESSTTLTIAHALAGGGTSTNAGGLTLTPGNTGTLILNGASTYTGTTTVNGGVLQGDIVSLPTNILTGALGNVTFNQMSPGTYSHVISGSGSVTLMGGSSLTFSMANTYTNGTTINSGNILMLSGSGSLSNMGIVSVDGTLNISGISALSTTIGTLSGTNTGIVTMGTKSLNLNTSSSSTFAGSITGTGGTLSQVGNGILTLSGPVTLTGGMIDIQSGQLNINGMATADTLTVESGTTLGGIGTITANVNVHGTVSPGTSIGTLHVVGNMDFLSGSFLDIEISPSAADELVATGSVNVTDATLDVTVLNGSYTIGTTYDIVAGNTISFPFLAVNIPPLPTRQQLIVKYSSMLIQLIIENMPFTQFVQGGNAGAVAAAFDTLNVNNPDVLFLDNFLDNATFAQLQCDFDQMQPASFNAVAIIQETASTALRSLFSERLQEIHGTCCERDLLKTMSYGLWFSPFGNFSKQKSRNQEDVCNQTKIGFHADTYGATIGFDGEVSNSPFHNIILGGALSYVNTNLHWYDSQAKSVANDLFGSLYGTVFNEDYYLDLALMGAYCSFKAKRNIFLTNQTAKIQRTAKHTNNAGEFDGHVAAGITFNSKCWQLRPFGAIDYIYVGEAGYRERGANSINMVVRNKFSNMLRGEVGLGFSSWQTQEGFAWSEDLKLSYVHEERYKGEHTKVRFVDSSHRFEVTGFLPDRDLIAPAFSIHFFIPSIDFSISASYSGEFGNKWQTQTGDLQFLWRF